MRYVYWFVQGANRMEAGAGGASLVGSEEGVPLVGSNGAGKTTLAMAALWALTGATDARADGKAVESRGVIHDGASRATVTLR